jgi:predicted AlkP superfamily pyrophosphatase or phosphodiesterase
MKKVLVTLLCFLFFGFAGSAQRVEHVVLITIDGFRPDFYMDPSWNAVNIRQLMADGTRAVQGVNSVFPSMTYPSHTTIVTGVQPAKHGVYFNKMFEPNGPTGRMYWNDTSIHVPTVWDAAEKKGMTVAALFWPVSADAPVQYNIPDNGDMGEAAQDKYSKPAGFVDDLKKNVFDNVARINYGKDHNAARIAAYVIGKSKPNLMTIHFFSVDHYEHMQGRQGDSVRAAVHDADSSVGIVVDALKKAGIWDKTVIIVTGDHGFMDVKTSVNPNIWLVEAGLITDVKTDNWKAQFFSVGGSTYLYLKDPNDKETLAKVKEVLANRPEEEKKLFRMIDRAKLDAIGANPLVPFALTAENGASFGNAMKGDAVKPSHGGTHGHFPDFYEIRTGYVACGPGIRKGGEIKEMNQRDQATIIAKLLGLSLPTSEGKIPAGLLAE